MEEKNSFEYKVEAFLNALGGLYTKDKEGENKYHIEITDENMAEDFTAMLYAMEILHKTVTESDGDLFDFIAILNKLAVKKYGETILKHESEKGTL